MSERWGLDLWAKRDDLIPQFLGGNKVRKVHRIVSDAVAASNMPDLLITNGGTESNHARVVALIGARLGLQVHLVLHGQPKPANVMQGNAYFYHAAQAQVTCVKPESIAGTIAEITSRAQAKRKRVLVIPGGGHCHEAVEAYAGAVAELPFSPDFIVHASGTGGTQAGLVTGGLQASSSIRVIGISVARSAERGKAEVSALLPTTTPDSAIIFDDRFRFGGYEHHSPTLLEFMREVVRLEGLPLDPTYTGKAMFGLKKLVDDGEIPKGSRVVFWHTGGLLNLQSYHESKSGV